MYLRRYFKTKLRILLSENKHNLIGKFNLVIRYQEKNLNLNRDSNLNALLKWHPSQEGDLNVSWHDNQDSSSCRAPG